MTDDVNMDMDVDMDVDDNPSAPTIQATTPNANPAFPLSRLPGRHFSHREKKPSSMPVWVHPPDDSTNVLRVDDETIILSHWNDHNTINDVEINAFLQRWPPSRTPIRICQWIQVYRGGLSAPPSQQDVKELSLSFQRLLQSQTVSVEELDRISLAHNVLIGKWLIFTDQWHIDALWRNVVKLLCMKCKKGCAKVSARKEELEERQVICVYVNNYLDAEEVQSARGALRSIGIKWKIGFKPDSYTHLGIYSQNAWNIRPTRFFE